MNPDPSELPPASRDPWLAPDWDRSALITIDIQRDTLDGKPFEFPGTRAVLPAIRKLLAAFRSASRPIVHVVRLYQADGSNVDLCRRTAVQQGLQVLVPGSPGSQLPTELLPQTDLFLDPELLLRGGSQQLGSDEVALYKPRWGAFFGTTLEEHLRDASVTTLVFCGANFPNCPRTSIYEASERDFRVVVADDALSGLYPRGVDELQRIGVTVLPVYGIAAALRNPAQSQ